MKTGKKILIASLGLIVAGSGYAVYRYFKKQAQLIEDYDIEPVGAKIIRWDQAAGIGIIEFTIRITNKSAIEATIKELYSDLYLGNQYVGYMSNTGSMLVPGKGTADAKITITIATKQILKDFANILSVFISTKDLQYRIKGYVKLKSSFISVSVPFDEVRSIKKDFLPVPVST